MNLDELWTGILELIASIIIPVWANLIQYIPLALLGLLILTVVGLAWWWQRHAAVNRPRVPVRQPAGRMPADLHVPGPSIWPFVGPLGLPPIVVPLLVLAIAIAVPVGWVLLTRRDIASRRGLALVLTPSELLLRTRSGVIRTVWGSLLRVTLDGRLAWSVLEGVHRARALVLKRRGADPITYDEAYLGVPAEVAQTLLDAYRRGSLPRP